MTKAPSDLGEPPAAEAPSGDREGRPRATSRFTSVMPTKRLMSTRLLELRRRHVLVALVALLTIGIPVVVLGIRLLLHEFDPKSFGPAGSPGVFQGISDTVGEFGFIVAAALGATAATSDLSEGVFRQLVITGRSRLSLYLARLPAGLSIVLPLVAIGFTLVCLVTSFEGTPQPTSINANGVSIPLQLNEAQLQTWLLQHPRQAREALGISAPAIGGQFEEAVRQHSAAIYSGYTAAETSQFNPAMNEMAKIGLWLELEAGIGFTVGLGLGSLLGQRTVPIVILIVLEIIVTPLLATHAIPYFLNGQRLIVGVAMDQLRPAGLPSAFGGGGGQLAARGHGALGIPPMPTWAMVAVIVGWIVVWTGIGARKMVTRDA